MIFIDCTPKFLVLNFRIQNSAIINFSSFCDNVLTTVPSHAKNRSSILCDIGIVNEAIEEDIDNLKTECRNKVSQLYFFKDLIEGKCWEATARNRVDRWNVLKRNVKVNNKSRKTGDSCDTWQITYFSGICHYSHSRSHLSSGREKGDNRSERPAMMMKKIYQV